ncbi:MAG: XrtB/PEP-CTERM-associated transcriptional regulator EpsA [Rhodoferax sp.]
MDFLPSLAPDELRCYHRVVSHATQVRSHFDMLVWLQGDMQRYLPHEIMLATWGNFDSGNVQHDIISSMAGIRSQNLDLNKITPMLIGLHSRWNESGNKPMVISSGDHGFLMEGNSFEKLFSHSFQKMRCAMVHGIADKRASHDCLYVAFRANEGFRDIELSALLELTPCIDAALRQVELLPQQAQRQIDPSIARSLTEDLHLSDREVEVLQWVTLGKTNPEIGSILKLSEFTIKNHMQRIFKKLEVSNRAQAVGKLRTLWNHV